MRIDMPAKRPCLYLLADESYGTARLPKWVALILAGGAQIVQLRAPKAPSEIRDDLGLQLRRVTREQRAWLLINDDLDLCRHVQADGVHLGQTDMPAPKARRLLGDGALIGLTIHNEAQARSAPYEALNYVSLGSVFASATKPHVPQLGVQGAARLREVVREQSALPVFYIGGITLTNMAQLRPLQPAGLVVFNALAQASDPQAAARRMTNELTTWQSASA